MLFFPDFKEIMSNEKYIQILKELMENKDLDL